MWRPPWIDQKPVLLCIINIFMSVSCSIHFEEFKINKSILVTVLNEQGRIEGWFRDNLYNQDYR